MTSSGPHQISIGNRDSRHTLAAVRRLCGQSPGGPMGVAAQSTSRISAPIAPPAANIRSTSGGSRRSGTTWSLLACAPSYAVCSVRGARARYGFRSAVNTPVRPVVTLERRNRRDLSPVSHESRVVRTYRTAWVVAGAVL